MDTQILSGAKSTYAFEQVRQSKVFPAVGKQMEPWTQKALAKVTRLLQTDPHLF